MSSKNSEASSQGVEQEGFEYIGKSPYHISRRDFLKLAGGSALAPALGFTGFFYARDFETSWVELNHLRLSLLGLPEQFAGYRIVQISDLHLDEHTRPEYIDEVAQLVNEQNPDFIVSTGDYVTNRAEHFAPNLTAFLNQLRARDGAAAVLGNHDHDTNPIVLRQAIERSSTKSLDNRVLTIERENAALHFGGVDDIWMGRPDLAAVLAQLPHNATNSASILLAHEPDFADTVSQTGRFDLQLSGHSHGGQVRLPVIGAPRLPPYARKYPMGLYRIGEMLLYTNRGIGMLPPRVRILCRPEITAFTLYPR